MRSSKNKFNRANHSSRCFCPASLYSCSLSLSLSLMFMHPLCEWVSRCKCNLMRDDTLSTGILVAHNINLTAFQLTFSLALTKWLNVTWCALHPILSSSSSSSSHDHDGLFDQISHVSLCILLFLLCWCIWYTVRPVNSLNEFTSPLLSWSRSWGDVYSLFTWADRCTQNLFLFFSFFLPRTLGPLIYWSSVSHHFFSCNVKYT